MQKGQKATPPPAESLTRWVVLLKQEADPADLSKSVRYKRVEINAATADDAVKGCSDLPGELVDVQPNTPEGHRKISRHLPTPI